MSIQLLILKNGIITPPRSSVDIATISVPTAAPGTNTTQIASCAFVTNAVAGVSTSNFVSIGTAQTITGDKTFNGALQLPTTAGTTAGTIWRNGNNLEYKDGSTVTKILLNSAGNLSNLMDKQVSLNNLVGTQTASRVLRSDGINVTLSLVNLSTDVTNTLPIANGGTGSSTQNFVDISTNQTIAGIKTFSNTTASTSTTTGGTLFGGGVGIAGRLSATSGYFTTAFGAGNQTFDFTNSSIKMGVGTSGQDAIFALHCSGSGLGAIGFDFSSTRFVFGSNAGLAIDFCTNLGGTPGADNFASATPVLKISGNNITFSTIPTSPSGLTTGMIWRNGNVINIV